jgi:hypothetical protein
MEVCSQEQSPSGHNKTMDRNESKAELVSTGVLGLLVGLSLIVAGFWVGRQLHIVWNTWPSTDGVVVRGTVQEVLKIPSTKGGMPFHTYTPKIAFRYTVGRKAYTTEAPSVNSATTFDRAAASLTGLYAAGTHHPIRYNPRNPKDIEFGTIKFGPLALALLLLTLGCVLAAVGVKSLVMSASQERDQATVKELPATMLTFPDRSKPEPLALTMICPSCGRRVMATEDSCPNCLKALRAA